MAFLSQLAMPGAGYGKFGVVKKTFGTGVLSGDNSPSHTSSFSAAPPESSWFQRVFDPSGVAQEYQTWALGQQMAFNRAEAERAREFNAAEARLAREWSERMSSTSYQRAVADLKKAGLNPYLVLSGSGSSTPSATAASGSPASASMTSVDFGATSRAFGSIANTAINVIGSVANTQMHLHAMQNIEKLRSFARLAAKAALK